MPQVPTELPEKKEQPKQRERVSLAEQRAANINQAQRQALRQQAIVVSDQASYDAFMQAGNDFSRLMGFYEQDWKFKGNDVPKIADIRNDFNGIFQLSYMMVSDDKDANYNTMTRKVFAKESLAPLTENMLKNMVLGNTNFHMLAELNKPEVQAAELDAYAYDSSSTGAVKKTLIYSLKNMNFMTDKKSILSAENFENLLKTVNDLDAAIKRSDYGALGFVNYLVSANALVDMYANATMDMVNMETALWSGIRKDKENKYTDTQWWTFINPNDLTLLTNLQATNDYSGNSFATDANITLPETKDGPKALPLFVKGLDFNALKAVQEEPFNFKYEQYITIPQPAIAQDEDDDEKQEAGEYIEKTGPIVFNEKQTGLKKDDSAYWENEVLRLNSTPFENIENEDDLDNFLFALAKTIEQYKYYNSAGLDPDAPPTSSKENDKHYLYRMQLANLQWKYNTLQHIKNSVMTPWKHAALFNYLTATGGAEGITKTIEHHVNIAPSSDFFLTANKNDIYPFCLYTFRNGKWERDDGKWINYVQKHTIQGVNSTITPAHNTLDKLLYYDLPKIWEGFDATEMFLETYEQKTQTGVKKLTSYQQIADNMSHHADTAENFDFSKDKAIANKANLSLFNKCQMMIKGRSVARAFFTEFTIDSRTITATPNSDLFAERVEHKNNIGTHVFNNYFTKEKAKARNALVKDSVDNTTLNQQKASRKIINFLLKKNQDYGNVSELASLLKDYDAQNNKPKHFFSRRKEAVALEQKRQGVVTELDSKILSPDYSFVTSFDPKTIKYYTAIETQPNGEHLTKLDLLLKDHDSLNTELPAILSNAQPEKKDILLIYNNIAHNTLHIDKALDTYIEGRVMNGNSFRLSADTVQIINNDLNLYFRNDLGRRLVDRHYKHQYQVNLEHINNVRIHDGLEAIDENTYENWDLMLAVSSFVATEKITHVEKDIIQKDVNGFDQANYLDYASSLPNANEGEPWTAPAWLLDLLKNGLLKNDDKEETAKEDAEENQERSAEQDQPAETQDDIEQDQLTDVQNKSTEVLEQNAVQIINTEPAPVEFIQDKDKQIESKQVADEKPAQDDEPESLQDWQLANLDNLINEANKDKTVQKSMPAAEPVPEVSTYNNIFYNEKNPGAVYRDLKASFSKNNPTAIQLFSPLNESWKAKYNKMDPHIWYNKILRGEWDSLDDDACMFLDAVVNTLPNFNDIFQEVNKPSMMRLFLANALSYFVNENYLEKLPRLNLSSENSETAKHMLYKHFTSLPALVYFFDKLQNYFQNQQQTQLPQETALPEEESIPEYFTEQEQDDSAFVQTSPWLDHINQLQNYFPNQRQTQLPQETALPEEEPILEDFAEPEQEQDNPTFMQTSPWLDHINWLQDKLQDLRNQTLLDDHYKDENLSDVENEELNEQIKSYYDTLQIDSQNWNKWIRVGHPKKNESNIDPRLASLLIKEGQMKLYESLGKFDFQTPQLKEALINKLVDALTRKQQWLLLAKKERQFSKKQNMNSITNSQSIIEASFNDFNTQRASFDNFNAQRQAMSTEQLADLTQPVLQDISNAQAKIRSDAKAAETAPESITIKSKKQNFQNNN